MSIVKMFGLYYPTCDICGDELPSAHDFYEAVLSKREAGWKTQKADKEWEDICEYCQKSEDE
jgi:hypothetical protein